MPKLELLDLPTEILSRIVKSARDGPRDFASDYWYTPHLITDSDLSGRRDPWDSPVTSPKPNNLMQRDLGIVATCRTLRAVAEPLLYYRLWPKNPALLLRTFLERPDLAQRVRSLDMSELYLKDLEGLDHESVDAAAADLGMTLPPEWWVMETEFERCCASDTVFAMLLALVAKGLEVLFVDSSFFDSSSSYEGFPSRLIADSEDVEFTNLRYFSMGHWDTEGGFDFAAAEHLLIRAPKLEHLWLFMCGGVSSFLDLDNVRSVRIADSVFDHEALSLLVRACPLLEDFSFMGANLPEGESHFTPRELLRVLRPKKGQLRQLAFDPDCNGHYLEWTDQDISDDEFWFDTLADFEKLETLEFPPEYFAAGRQGHVGNFINSQEFLELLPPNLRTLELVTPRQAAITLDGKIELVEAVKQDGLFPYLRTFVLDVEADRKEAVKDAFAAVGIEHRVRFHA